MKQHWSVISLAIILLGPLVAAQENSSAATPTFSAPVRLAGGQTPIRTEAPGYAAPCWADVTGDGKADLLVGQFNSGRIKIYPGNGRGGVGEGKWLQAGGAVAEVDGVW